jgi:hypothetical protein
LAGAGLCVVIGSHALIAMAYESVSFRISRNAEDLAQTVHALSQRLVRLEQRLEATELQLDRQGEHDPQEIPKLQDPVLSLSPYKPCLQLRRFSKSRHQQVTWNEEERKSLVLRQHSYRSAVRDFGEFPSSSFLLLLPLFARFSCHQQNEKLIPLDELHF